MTETADRRQRWQALAVLVFGACVIGLSPILVRLTQTGPAAAGFWRLAFALPFLTVMTLRNGAPPSDRRLGRPSGPALLAGLMFALDLGFWHYAVKYTSVANATVLPNLSPVVVTLIAWIFLRQRPRALFLLAVAVAVFGVWLMAVGKGGGDHLIDPVLGDILAASTAVWYALYMLAIAQGRKRQSASILMLWSSIVGAPLLLAAALVAHERVLPTGPSGWAACVGMGVVHVIGQGSIAWAMGRLQAATASVVVLAQPVVSAALGWALFAENIGPLQAAGAAVALAGVVLAQWVSRGAKPAA